MGHQFDYTEVVSNGFITTFSYFASGLNQFFLDHNYLNVYQIKKRASCIALNQCMNLIIDSCIAQDERAELQTDIEQDRIIIFTTSSDQALAIDSMVNLLYQRKHLEHLIMPRISELNCYRPNDIIELLNQPFEVVFETEHIGQLEWPDYARHALASGMKVPALNAYNKYYLATGNSMACFNVGVLLSMINLEQTAIEYYQAAIDLGYDAYHNLALAYLRLQQYLIALECVEQSNDKTDYKYFLLKAQILVKLNRHKQAISLLNEGYILKKNSDIKQANLIRELFLQVVNNQ